MTNPALDIMISARVSAATVSRLDAAAARLRCTRSDVMRHALDAYLRGLEQPPAEPVAPQPKSRSEMA